MLASAGQVDILDADHFLHIHLVFDHCNLRELRVIQTTEHLVDVHFCNTVRRLFEAVVSQVQTQCPHNVSECVSDDVITLVAG